MNSPQNILRVLKVWSLVLMVQGNELGLGFWFLRLKKREREGARKTRKKKWAGVVFCWNRPCVFRDPLVACFCRPSRYDVRLICRLWQPRTSSVTFELWSLHYMQITTAFLVKLKNNTGSWDRLSGQTDWHLLSGYWRSVVRQEVWWVRYKFPNCKED